MSQKLIDIGFGEHIPAGITLVTDSTGQFAFDPNSLEQTLTYNSAGDLETITLTSLEGHSFRQTLTYTSGKVSKISAWVKL